MKKELLVVTKFTSIPQCGYERLINGDNSMKSYSVACGNGVNGVSWFLNNQYKTNGLLILLFCMGSPKVTIDHDDDDGGGSGGGGGST